jgi:hypothetical protein
MPTFITIPAISTRARKPIAVAVEHITSIHTLEHGTTVHLIGGSIIQSTLKPAEVLDLINAAMHPTTETETR